ncbi:hypothetical protein [Holdemanella biformis]
MENSIYIQDTIKAMKELIIRKEKLESQIKNYENRIKKHMQYYGLEEIYGDEGERITFTMVTSKRFDSKKFKILYSELYDNFLKEVHNHRFRFTY